MYLKTARKVIEDKKYFLCVVKKLEGKNKIIKQTIKSEYQFCKFGNYSLDWFYAKRSKKFGRIFYLNGSKNNW